MCPKNPTQVIGFGSSCLYCLSHFSGPVLMFYMLNKPKFIGDKERQNQNHTNSFFVFAVIVWLPMLNLLLKHRNVLCMTVEDLNHIQKWAQQPRILASVCFIGTIHSWAPHVWSSNCVPGTSPNYPPQHIVYWEDRSHNVLIGSCIVTLICNCYTVWNLEQWKDWGRETDDICGIGQIRWHMVVIKNKLTISGFYSCFNVLYRWLGYS